MKAFWKIIGFSALAVLILLILAVVGGLFFLKSFDIKKYKPQIIQAATQALGRAVDFKDIELEASLDKGVRLHLGDLTIAEAPEFGNGHFATVKQVDAGVDILSFVLSRRVSVPGIVINSPQIDVVRNDRGVLNISTLGQTAGSTAKPSPSSSVAALPAVFINSLKIENAQMTLIDKSVMPELRLSVSQLTLDVQRFSLSDPFDVMLEAALLSPQKNFRLEGQVQLRLDNKEVKLSEMGVALDLGQLPLETLRVFPMLAGVPFPQLIDGQVKLKIKQAEVSEKGLGKILMDASFSGGKVIAPDIVPGVSLEAKQIEFSAENLSLDSAVPAAVSLKAALYQDAVNVDLGAKVLFDLKTSSVKISDGQLTTDLSLWPAKKIKAQIAALKDVPLPENLSGKVLATIKELSLSPAGLQSILLDVKLDGAAVDLSALMPPAAGGIPAFLSKTDLAINNFSLGKQFSVILKTAYASEVQNVTFDGIIAFDPAAQALAVKNGIAGIDLNNFPLEKFKNSPLVPAGTPFPKILGGRLQFNIHDLAASAKGLDTIDMSVKWQSGKIAVDEVSPGISVAANQIMLEVQNFSLAKPFQITGSLGYESDEPNVYIDGQASFDLASQKISLKDFNVRTDLGKLPYDQIKAKVAPLKDVKLPEVLKGALEVTVKELSVGAGPQGLGPVLVDLGYHEGEVSLKDISPGVSFTASQIDANVKDFSFGKPVSLDVQLAYLSPEPNVWFGGNVSLDLAGQSVSLDNSHLKIDLSRISFEQLKLSIASLKDASLPESLKGELNISIPSATAGAAGLKSLTSDVTLKDWQAKFKELIVPVSGAETKFKVTESQLTSDELRFNLGKGQITAKVDVTDYLAKQNFNFSAEIKDLDLTEVLEQSKAPVKVAGLVSATVKAQGQGADMNSVTGDGTIDVKDAKLLDLNVLKTVLDKIDFIPNLLPRVKAKLPEHYLAKLEDADTVFKKVSSAIVISGGKIVLNPISIEADEFIYNSQGQVAFDLSYELEGSFQITSELSAIMGDSSEELKYMYDANNLITLPVPIKGKGAGVPEFSVKEMVKEMGKNAARQQVKKEISRALGKVLGDAAAHRQESAPEGSEEPQQENPGSKIIGGILDKVFK